MNFPFDPNAQSQENFVDRVGGVYEHSAWIAEGAFARGLPENAQDLDTLASYLRAIVDVAGDGPKLALLRAHPDLAGKLAKSGALTTESTVEQTSAGLDQCSDAEFEELTVLNDTYKERFGFPYILAVKGRNRQEILENFRARVNNAPADEFREALNQVHQIARLRLEAMC